MVSFILFKSPPNGFTAISVTVVLYTFIALSHNEVSDFISFFF